MLCKQPCTLRFGGLSHPGPFLWITAYRPRGSLTTPDKHPRRTRRSYLSSPAAPETLVRQCRHVATVASMVVIQLTPFQTRFSSIHLAYASVIFWLILGCTHVASATTVESIDVSLTSRAPTGTSSLSNNAPQNKNISPGESQYWVVPQTVLHGAHGDGGVGFPSDRSINNTHQDESNVELRKRQGSIPVWITINTCLQPISNSTNDPPPAQLQLWVSTAPENTRPGPSATDQSTQIEVSGGYGMVNTTASDDVHISIIAPNTTGFTGSWNYEIAASIDAPFHRYTNSSTELLFIDGDDHAALLVTADLTHDASNSSVFQQWMALTPPYGMFASHHANRSILGLSRSYCGLARNARIMANIPNVQNQNTVVMTTRGKNSKPKQQFYINNLASASTYYGFLAISGNSTASGTGVVGGGGHIYRRMNFTTKSSSNCALMYNLTFCSEVAYAVPSNPNKFPPATGLQNLGDVYDNYAQSMYQYFNYSLQQIPCNTHSSAQYSLARNCTDCARAYKSWLCATTIPRCEDWDNDAPYLAPRNVAQSFVNGTSPPWISDQSLPQNALLSQVVANRSRNSIIDSLIQPGPYKEVLPCADLCYDLVQSCPAALQFGCPKGKWLNMSYGFRSADPGVLSCSFPGAAYYLSDAVRDDVKERLLMATITGVLVVLTVVVL